MNNNNTWNKEIKEKRLACGLTQRELAAYAGISENYLTGIENGNKNPSPK